LNLRISEDTKAADMSIGKQSDMLIYDQDTLLGGQQDMRAELGFAPMAAKQ
jgi:hypothetical protein